MMKLLVILALASSAVSDTYKPSKIDWTKVNQDEWWGPEEGRDNQDTSIIPTSIVFDDEMIADLKQRLQNRREYTASLKDVGFTYGFNSDAMPYWADYWANSYDFKAREQFLNQFPMYKTNIQGLNIHFIWIKPEVPAGKTMVPMLLMHGFPGSIREFYEAIPKLAAVDNDRDYVLELVVPCLPGYGYSDAAVKPGMGGIELGVIMKNLMARLGYPKFYIQGGDWGSIIGSFMATMYSEEVLGYHSNFPITPTAAAIAMQVAGSIIPPLIVDSSLQDRMYPLTKVGSELLLETGFIHLQATKPDTIGIVLEDTPTGLLAYIFEKFSSGADTAYKNLADGGLKNTFTPEQLLDNLMFYWAPKRITTAARLYAETFNTRELGIGVPDVPTPVPTWALQAKYELAYQSPSILKTKYQNLLNATALDFGGHFLALQAPEDFTADVTKAMSEFLKWHQSNEVAEKKGLNILTVIPETVDKIASALKKLPIIG